MAEQPKYYHPSFLKGESVIVLPIGNNRYIFFGIGKVFRVIKGEEFDLAFIEFRPTSINNHPLTRTVIVKNNHPRRQLLTLKRGHFCMVYGFAYLISREDTDKDNVKKYWKKWQLYAFALQGWHTPTMFDIKRMRDNNETDEEKFEDMSELQQGFFENILDQLGEIDTDSEESEDE